MKTLQDLYASLTLGQVVAMACVIWFAVGSAWLRGRRGR